jgi:hypothetical protein
VELVRELENRVYLVMIVVKDLVVKEQWQEHVVLHPIANAAKA